MTERVRDVRDRSTEPGQRPSARRTISFLSILARVVTVPALLSRADLDPPPGMLVSAPGIGIPLSPLLVAAGLFVLAEVFRRGRLMSRDVEGLV